MQKIGREDIFVKFYVRARTSGLISAMSSQNWRLLCVLATYMNKDGICNPSQATLARDLRISRGSVARQIRGLCQFRFQGSPVLEVSKDNRYFGGKFGASTYRILPLSCLQIFVSHSHKK